MPYRAISVSTFIKARTRRAGFALTLAGEAQIPAVPSIRHQTQKSLMISHARARARLREVRLVRLPLEHGHV
jgi:hypothetical protein